jgi:uncharacterized SAM-binding protein YcdF (DUF218 family)
VKDRPRFPFKLVFAFLVIVALLYFGRVLWLPIFGHLLIHNDGPAKADIVVVLAGDFWGNRITKAAELVRAGYAPAILVSGPAGMYGVHECDLAIPFAMRKGYPAEWFIGLPNSSTSTREEARIVLEDLKRRGVHSFLLVTSDYHTGRSTRIYRAAEREMGGGPEMRVVAAPDEHFHADSWWRTRSGQKVVFTEWTKSLATALGM